MVLLVTSLVFESSTRLELGVHLGTRVVLMLSGVSFSSWGVSVRGKGLSSKHFATGIQVSCGLVESLEVALGPNVLAFSGAPAFNAPPNSIGSVDRHGSAVLTMSSFWGLAATPKQVGSIWLCFCCKCYFANVGRLLHFCRVFRLFR